MRRKLVVAAFAGVLLLAGLISSSSRRVSTLREPAVLVALSHGGIALDPLHVRGQARLDVRRSLDAIAEEERLRLGRSHRARPARSR